MFFGHWGVQKTDTLEETADPSIASEDAIAQGNEDDDSSRNSSRSLDCIKIDSRKEEARVHEKILEGSGRPGWFVFLQENIKWIFTTSLVILGVLIVITSFAAKSDTAVPRETQLDRFDFSDPFNDFFFTETPTVSPTSNPTSVKRLPTFAPLTNEPTLKPTIEISNENTEEATKTEIPSSKPSESPTTSKPSESPTTIAPSTQNPTETMPPSEYPSSGPTYLPTEKLAPIPRPPILPFRKDLPESVLQFCVVADAPYTKDELKALPKQIASQTDGCEFLVHLGDIFIGDTNCDADGYETMQEIMLKSHAPAFLVPGDNEWNDCFRGNINKGWRNWADHFIGLENNWDHDYTIHRQPGYDENFYFITKRTLIFGLNIVGGRVHNRNEWSTRLRDEYFWVREVMMESLMGSNTTADGVILMAHANPSAHHANFFTPFRVFMRDELKNEFPVLYLHGDGHNFMYTPRYQNQTNFLRIQHEGGTIEPVLKILARPGRGPGQRSSVYDAFQYDRQLELMKN